MDANKLLRLGPDYAVYFDQPTDDDLRELRSLGFETIVNSRGPDEMPFAEGPIAARLGFRYVELPIAAAAWRPQTFEELLVTLSAPGTLPALFHSRAGRRAAILALVWNAVREGLTLDELDERADRLGLVLPEVARRFVEERSAAYAAPPPR